MFRLSLAPDASPPGTGRDPPLERDKRPRPFFPYASGWPWQSRDEIKCRPSAVFIGYSMQVIDRHMSCASSRCRQSAHNPEDLQKRASDSRNVRCCPRRNHERAVSNRPVFVTLQTWSQTSSPRCGSRISSSGSETRVPKGLCAKPCLAASHLRRASLFVNVSKTQWTVP